MRQPKNVKCHQCAPKEWRHTPNMTGDYDLDSTIMHRGNRDMPARLGQHLSSGSGPRTAYNGYHGYKGDS